MDFLDQYIPLNLLPIGETGIVQKLLSTGTQRRRMLDLGLVNGTPVEALQKSPSGDPTAYFIRGAVIALRSEDAGKILVAVSYTHLLQRLLMVIAQKVQHGMGG